jgi:hypothetical protein
MRQPGLPDARRSKRMREIAQASVVPVLRDLGFQGTMPNFHRQRSDRLDLFNVQFSYNGQYFFANLGRLQLPSDSSGSVAKPTKAQLNLANCPLDQRTRLATDLLPPPFRDTPVRVVEMWHFTAASDVEAEELMHRLARQLCELLARYADPWWRDEKLKGTLPQPPIGPA